MVQDTNMQNTNSPCQKTETTTSGCASAPHLPALRPLTFGSTHWIVGRIRNECGCLSLFGAFGYGGGGVRQKTTPRPSRTVCPSAVIDCSWGTCGKGFASTRY